MKSSIYRHLCITVAVASVASSAFALTVSNLGQTNTAHHVVATSFNPPAPSASPLVNGKIYEIVNEKSGFIFDIPHALTDPGTQISQYTANGQPNQRWKAVAEGANWSLISVSCRLSLDAVDGAVVTAKTTHAGTQIFKVVAADGGGFKLVVDSTGDVVDVADGAANRGGKIITSKDIDAPSQHWSFKLIP